jgi:dihydropteroate synthase
MPGPLAISEWAIAGGSLDVGRPVVVGILNLTPDSFSDGGSLSTVEEALAHARRLQGEGAQILDVGGESTRPGAHPVSPEEEADRVLPFIRRAREGGLGPISIDTRHAEVAREAVEAGARIINDVSGFRHDPGMAQVAAEGGVGVVLSHMRGTPATMKELAEYENLTSEIEEELSWSVARAVEAGVPRNRLVVDPGIGFAKTAPQSLFILRNLAFLRALECPIMVGPSRKSFMDRASGVPPSDRTPGTIAACIMAYLGGARLFRVHDVAPIVQAMAVTRAILEAEQ